MFFIFFFFFSSRRRHTRSLRDWSSDVCSSDLTDFGNPWPRGPLPSEALVSEFIVGFLDRERGAGVEWSAAEFRGAAATYFVQHACDAPCTVTDNDLRQVRDKRQELFAQWAALPAGETLELRFSGPGPCLTSA